MKTVLFIIIFSLAVLDQSCKKFITVPPPTTQLVTSSVFSNDQTAFSAMNGLYSFMVSNAGFSNGQNSSVGFLCGLSADELTNYATDPNQIEFYLNDLDKNNSLLYVSLWQAAFQCIYQSNAVIEGLQNAEGVSQPVKNELTGEAKFVRAFCNFYLVNLFGDIPLVNTTDYKTTALEFRTNRDSIYSQIKSDLLDAQSMLSSDYSFSNGERVRPNTWAATALLARVYLYMGEWMDAQVQATAVINQKGLYGILSDLNQVFLANSNEAIWQLLPNQPGLNTGEGFIYILTSAPAYATLSPQLLSSFEAGDLRMTSWISDTTIETTTYYYPFKYKVKSSETLTEYSMVLRLAEQYLIRAEAMAHLNNLTAALSDVNIIRERAGLNDLVPINQDSLLQAIQHERQVELFTEWGHRWMDLKRTGTATAVLSSIKSGWQPLDTLYPIPQGDIQRDPNLSQNLGY